jgi:predicted nucleic acid binding AN1-type Zn finger protein
MHVLQIYECQSEQCKYCKEEYDKDNSDQDILDSIEETMEHKIQEDRDKFLEDEEEYTP